ncbi:Transcriptional regulator, contains XRE-family HTH domain [Pseudobutyrivibrio sp. C4]|uniref:helix-turn-helix domain-containing protein n=1 Tax=Pseudobutyrivibrio sp. C4 TaxID=1520803 RepID=UPI0008AD8C4C|nr:helix-turn-helix transcriptional regulator [Pseudobutyrivibrio sp. C4]SES87398.1 Transcriptional regulator, contains XRE-family HTH domain [Pseudobutyrivibrio sp. C4]
MTITERIFFLIKERGLSQNAFGKAAGIAPSTISDWKRKGHTPSADKIMDICKALDVTPEQLLTGKDIDENYIEPTVDYVARKQDEELFIDRNSLKKDQKKRLKAYVKALKQLEELEDI